MTQGKKVVCLAIRGRSEIKLLKLLQENEEVWAVIFG